MRDTEAWQEVTFADWLESTVFWLVYSQNEAAFFEFTQQQFACKHRQYLYLLKKDNSSPLISAKKKTTVLLSFLLKKDNSTPLISAKKDNISNSSPYRSGIGLKKVNNVLKTAIN